MTTGEVYNYDKFGKSCVQYIHEFKDHISNTRLPAILSTDPFLVSTKSVNPPKI